MKKITLLFFALLIFGCKEYSKKDIKGGWNTMIDDQYCELWFEDDLVLDWNYELGIVRLRDYEIKDNVIHFSHQHFSNETPHGIAFSFKIKSLRNGSMTLEDVIHPEHPKFIYNSIDEKAPDFSLDILSTEKQLELERKLRRSSEKRIPDFY